MSCRPSSASVKTRKGFYYPTVKAGRSNYNIVCVRNYTLEPQGKHDVHRLYPDYLFDWKEIGQQLAEKREVYRAYRFKRRAPRSAECTPEPFVMMSYDPKAHMAYTSDAYDSMALLNAVLHMERTHKKWSRQAVQPTPDIPCNRLQKMIIDLQSSAMALLPQSR